MGCWPVGVAVGVSRWVALWLVCWLRVWAECAVGVVGSW